MAARRGAVIKYWRPRRLEDEPNNPYAIGLDARDLLPMISPRTRLVAFTACSNILGSILPVSHIVHGLRLEARSKGCRKLEISLDCVAYAPHARMDVKGWDVDYAVFSFYKALFSPSNPFPILR
jgi:selenocysteine lyase/cysteine desulfurase